MNYSTSQQLIKNTKIFLSLKLYTFFDRLLEKKGTFYGWGRKKSGLKAVALAKKFGTSFVLLEDGFIRSIGLGVDGSPSFSLVEDNVGIYYDATTPSKLENILNTYDFSCDTKLMQQANKAIELILQHNISKYNNALNLPKNLFPKEEKRVLVVAQTAGDASLKYGMLKNFTTDEMIQTAIEQNPDATVYLKIHPDVLSGKKDSDITLENLNKEVVVIEKNYNPIALLKHFDKVYTKTSGMGFEALLVGCEVVCFGMPFYAGWGITTDKVECKRRKKQRTIQEVFAAAYILYTRYYNPYKNRACDIFETIEEILHQKTLQFHKA